MKINLHCLSFWSFIPKIHKIPTYHWSKTIENGGKSHCVRNTFSISCWPQLLAPNYCNVLFPAQQLWVFSYNAWRVWRTPDKRSETIFFIQNLSRSFRFTAPWRCFSSSVHLTHFLQGSGQRTGMAIAEAWFCAQWPIFVLFLRFVFGLLSGWKIQTWPIIRFLTGSVTYWFFICWYLIESMMPCV